VHLGENLSRQGSSIIRCCLNAFECPIFNIFFSLLVFFSSLVRAYNPDYRAFHLLIAAGVSRALLLLAPFIIYSDDSGGSEESCFDSSNFSVIGCMLRVRDSLICQTIPY